MRAIDRNRQWVLAAYPAGEAEEATWQRRDAEIPQPGPGQILVRTQWLSVDPYMRGRLGRNAGMKIGQVMQGGGVGEVVASNHPAWKVGDIAESLDVNWQEYAVLTPDLAGPAAVNKVDVSSAPAQASLHWLGMPGFTAYFAMLDVGRPRPGDVVLVSAAAGAVGQIAGQIAKLAGCRVIGIAGSDDKLAWCKQIGFDEVVNYKTSPDLAAEVARICPNGVNVFFDGTGGAVHDAVMQNLAQRARVVIVGKVAVANKAPDQDIGLRASSRMIATRAVVQGFVVFDWWHRRDEAARRLTSWFAEGRLQIMEDVVEGFDNVPQAFVRMMRGDNLGKQLVRVR